MQAARIVDGTVEILDVPVPVPGHEEALIRISASGVCHSDLHIARGDWYGVPRTGGLGHEAIGIVEALGPGADRFVQVGDRVILGLGGWAAATGAARASTACAGQPRLCARVASAIWARSPSTSPCGREHSCRSPTAWAIDDAPLACGGLTAYGAVKKLVQHQVMPGRPVAIIGAAGGLGHYAVQIATAFGYTVIGIDVGEDRLEFVRSLGARPGGRCRGSAVDVVQREFGGVDASLVFSARSPASTSACELLRKSGLFVGVGLPPTSEGNIQINPFEFFIKDPTLIYSAVGTVQDMRELVDWWPRGG